MVKDDEFVTMTRSNSSARFFEVYFLTVLVFAVLLIEFTVFIVLCHRGSFHDSISSLLLHFGLLRIPNPCEKTDRSDVITLERHREADVLSAILSSTVLA